MSAFCLIPDTTMAADPTISARVTRSLERQGFSGKRSFTWNAGAAHWYPSMGQADTIDNWYENAEGIVACVGTLFYHGLRGSRALHSLWHDFSTPMAISRESLTGNFAVAIVKCGKCWVFADRVGMIKLYFEPKAGILSTSWLACLEACKAPTIDRLGALDFVLSGANHGIRTPVTGVRIVDPTMALAWEDHCWHPISHPDDWLRRDPITSAESAIDEAAGLLQTRMRDVSAAFDSKIRAALSGGFDSRLIVAALRSIGVMPSLHVYGTSSEADVQIAKSICRTLDVDLRHVDKDLLDARSVPIVADLLDSQSDFFDGIPTDGVLDLGSDRATRLTQSANGAIALNGGGGEVLRNFFYLRDRTFSSSEIVDAFYSNFLPRIVARTTDLSDYRDYLETSVEQQIGRGTPLSRRHVELIYPLFRCRFWTSRNNSLAARCGHFLTPLLDPALIEIGNALSLKLKDYGRFESQLIDRLSPELGRHPLVYGFSPAVGPSRLYALTMWVQHRRPTWLRANTARLKSALGRLPAVPPPAKWIDQFEAPLAIDEIFHTEAFHENGHWARALTLEWLIRRHHIRV